MLESRLLQLEDGLRAGKMSNGTSIWGRDEIAAAIHTVRGILYSTALSDDWYCFWCGNLLPENVRNDETCDLCGNQLPNDQEAAQPAAPDADMPVLDFTECDKCGYRFPVFISKITGKLIRPAPRRRKADGHNAGSFYAKESDNEEG